MGVHKNIAFDRFPKQGKWKGRRVSVCFNYDTCRTIPGTIVRDDAEEPGLTIIKLADGRYVEATECQYQLMKERMSEFNISTLGKYFRRKDGKIYRHVAYCKEPTATLQALNNGAQVNGAVGSWLLSDFEPLTDAECRLLDEAFDRTVDEETK